MLRFSKNILSFSLKNSRFKKFQNTLNELQKYIINVKTTIQNFDPDIWKYSPEALKVNTITKILNLSDNQLGSNPENMKYLAEALKSNSTIQ